MPKGIGIFKSSREMDHIRIRAQEQQEARSMAFTTSHTESGEGSRGIKAAVDRTLDWLKNAEPGGAPVRWRITMSFKEGDENAKDNESARRSGKLPLDGEN